MSPKVALGLILLCFVLLGQSDAQRQQRQQQVYRGRPGVRQNIRGRTATDQPGQGGGGTAPECIDKTAQGGSDQPAPGGGNKEPAGEIDRTQNTLAANIKDNRKPH